MDIPATSLRGPHYLSPRTAYEIRRQLVENRRGDLRSQLELPLTSQLLQLTPTGTKKITATLTQTTPFNADQAPQP